LSEISGSHGDEYDASLLGYCVVSSGRRLIDFSDEVTACIVTLVMEAVNTSERWAKF
jgi:hypothetical protein